MRRCPLPLFRLFALASLLVVVTCRSNYASKYDDRFRHYNREQNEQQDDQDHDYGFQRVAREREGHLSNDYLKGKFGMTSDKRTPTFKSFQPGYKFQFLYDSQTTSGYAPWVSVQRAMGRFQALATFEAIGPGEASMQLSECLIGQLNGQSPTAGVWNPGQLLPVRVFESVMHFSHVQLEQPVRFTYSRDGIHHIYFDPMEPAWSRNYKK
uniref:Vitellogenin domain-containing protein n=1 Tax=Globodera pallida TaxID=36090 RepID=A0A183CS38_GLOPA